MDQMVPKILLSQLLETSALGDLTESEWNRATSSKQQTIKILNVYL